MPDPRSRRDEEHRQKADDGRAQAQGADQDGAATPAGQDQQQGEQKDRRDLEGEAKPHEDGRQGQPAMGQREKDERRDQRDPDIEAILDERLIASAKTMNARPPPGKAAGRRARAVRR